MIQKEIGKDIAIEEREQFLRDNCDAVEEVTYSKLFSPEELAKEQDALAKVSIEIADIEEEKKEVMDGFKERLKPLQTEKQEAIQRLKSKSQIVTEECFKFFYEEDKMVGFFNKQGDLVSSRPAFPNEMQRTIFADFRKNGTNN